MPSSVDAFQAAGGWRDREVRKMTKLATGSLKLALLVLPMSAQAQVQNQALAQIPGSVEAGTLKRPELVRTLAP